VKLTEREWRTSYRHEDGDLIELFYNPALTCAVQYDRGEKEAAGVPAHRGRLPSAA
jgi:hypothetical protein